MGLFRSLRVRLALWYVAVLAIVLAAFCAVVYFTMRQQLSSNLDDSLEARTETLLGVVQYAAAGPTLEGVVSQTGVDVEEQLVRVYDAEGALVFDSSGGAIDPLNDDQALQKTLSGEVAKTSQVVGDDTLRVRIVPLFDEGDLAGALEVGLPEDDIDETLGTLLLIMAIAYPATLIVASAGGVFLAGRALAPIDSVTRLARRITGADLSQRLNLDLPDDEVGRLARTFDEMIDRLDEAFQRQRQFTADASHELRTPLTAIRGQIEVTLKRDRDAVGYRDVLRGVNEEIDRLISLVGSLLTLARADAGEIALASDVVDAGALARSAVEQLRPLAEQKGLDIAVQDGRPLRVELDEDLVLQLLLNLLDNAIKYTESGTVTVGWDTMPEGPRLYVRDTGEGIAAEHIEKVFDRFYRIDTARSRAEGGAGLGLSISRWIAEAHGGFIALESEPGRGSTVEFRIPPSRFVS